VQSKAPTKEKVKVINRLRRLEGQVRGLQKMVEDERDCREILTLLSGVRSALDSTADVILETYLKECQHHLLTGEGDIRDIVNVVKLARG
jgi:CsoR family transcriptional regulator, copper-sensing transcriptional repressor